MFHAPTTESKQQNDPSRKQPTAEHERILSPHVPVVAGQFGLGAGGSVPPGSPLSSQPQLARLHRTYGNQAVLRMLGRVGQMQSPSPVATPVLQRKCACGGSGGSGGECTECAQKRSDADHEDTLRVQALVMGPHSRPSSHIRGEYKCGCVSHHNANHLGSLEDKTEALTNKEYHCPPAAGTLFDIEAAAGAGTLGLTRIDKASSQLMCLPKFIVNSTAGTCTVKVPPVSLSMISKSAPANPKSATTRTRIVPNCANAVPVFVNVTSANEALIKAGEQEHCDDHTRAFNLTLKPCSDALKKLDGTDVPGKSDSDCYAAVVAKLGFDPIDCTLEFVTLANKTQERDDKGMHTFDETQASANCTEVIDNFQKSSMTSVQFAEA